MPHDVNGQPLAVKSVQTTEEYCNLSVESEHGRKPDGLKETMTINAATVAKVVAIVLMAMLASLVFAPPAEAGPLRAAWQGVRRAPAAAVELVRERRERVHHRRSVRREGRQQARAARPRGWVRACGCN